MPATEASGNGPDTAERAPLDARGWVALASVLQPLAREAALYASHS